MNCNNNVSGLSITGCPEQEYNLSFQGLLDFHAYTYEFDMPDSQLRSYPLEVQEFIGLRTLNNFIRFTTNEKYIHRIKFTKESLIEFALRLQEFIIERECNICRS